MSSSFIIILIVSLGMFITCQGDVIGNFCSISINPSLCDQVLRSDPRSNGQNGQALAVIALEKGESVLRNSIKVAESFGGAYKEQIKTCIDNFNFAIENLESGKALLQKSDESSIDDLKSYAASALANVGYCNKEFGAGEPSKLIAASDKAYAITQLFSIIVSSFK